MSKLCFGVGISDGGYGNVPIFSKWYEMIRRVHSERYLEKYPTYRHVSVCEEWLHFSNFEEWATPRYFENCVLDKDILSGGTKIYSPNTCCFVPEKINLLFLNSKSKEGLPLGVTVDPRKKEGTRRFVARVGCSVSKQNKHLGMFSTPEAAHRAWQLGKCGRILEEIAWWRTQESFNQVVAERLLYYHDRLLEASEKGVIVASILN